MGNDLLQEWLDKANNDLRSAEYLSTMHHPTPDEIICFLCQQAAEKYLKAFIFLQDIEPEKTHDLKTLLEICKKYNTDFSTLLLNVDILNKYSVVSRYPNELEITGEDMKIAIANAKV
ncbi:MAG: HEPN domain-containing protein, partial [Treponema sp.]|nr:HEPN domain-containing protein [Treponema sp.]